MPRLHRTLWLNFLLGGLPVSFQTRHSRLKTVVPPQKVVHRISLCGQKLKIKDFQCSLKKGKCFFVWPHLDISLWRISFPYSQPCTLRRKPCSQKHGPNMLSDIPIKSVLISLKHHFSNLSESQRQAACVVYEWYLLRQ